MRAKQFVLSLIALGLVGALCYIMLTMEEGTQAQVKLREESRAPLCIGGRVVDPETGKVLRGLEANGEKAPFLPVEMDPWRYRQVLDHSENDLGRTPLIQSVVNLKDDSFSNIHSPIVFSEDGQTELVRRQPDGKRIWKTILPESSHTVRPPQYAVAEKRILVVCGQGLAALDDANGALVWTSKGPNDRLAVLDGHVLATGRPSSDAPYELVSRRISDGKEVFRSPLATIDDPLPLVFGSGMYVVRDDKRAVVIDSDGGILHQLDEKIVACLEVDKALLLLSRKRLLRVSKERVEVLNCEVPSADLSSADMFLLVGGDAVMLAFYNQSALSDVWVSRVELKTLALKWSTTCKRPENNEEHSAFWHKAYCQLRDDWVFVVSQSADVDFLQILSATTGETALRHDYADNE